MVITRSIRSRDLSVECADRFSRMGENVLDAFEKLAATGREIGPLLQIRFGWSVLRLIEGESNLRVSEPDFGRWPEEVWMPTIDTTLEILAKQTALLHRIDVEGEDVFLDQFIVSAPFALARPRLFLRRVENISPEDSGWLLGATDDPEALTRSVDLERVRVSSLVTRRVALLQALVLPTGFVAVFSEDSLEEVLDAAGRRLLS